MKNIMILSTILLFACSAKEEANQDTQTKMVNVANAINKVERVIGQARIEPEWKLAALTAASDGIVKNIHVKENDEVRKDAILLTLIQEIEAGKIEQNRAKARTAQANIKAKKAEVDEWQFQLSNKEKELNRLLSLLRSGSETQQKVDDIETEVNVLKVQHQKALANLEIAESELNEWNKEYLVLQGELNQRFIKAPSDGKILTISTAEGNAISTSNSVIDFAPTGKLIAKVEIDELYANQIKEGQMAEIRLPGNDAVMAKGKVIFLASALKRKSLFSEEAGDQEDRRVREVKVALESSDALLINTRVECTILTK